jgi:hypothetical protein
VANGDVSFETDTWAINVTSPLLECFQSYLSVRLNRYIAGLLSVVYISSVYPSTLLDTFSFQVSDGTKR